MDGYVCLKPLKISGVEYQPGNHIPADEIPSSRVRALKQMGYIAEQDAAPLAKAEADTRNALEVYVTIPIAARDDTMDSIVRASEKSLTTATDILQMTVEQAGDAIKDTADETALRLVHALDSRKGVKTAAAAKLEDLRGGDAG